MVAPAAVPPARVRVAAALIVAPVSAPPSLTVSAPPDSRVVAVACPPEPTSSVPPRSEVPVARPVPETTRLPPPETVLASAAPDWTRTRPPAPTRVFVAWPPAIVSVPWTTPAVAAAPLDRVPDPPVAMVVACSEAPARTVSMPPEAMTAPVIVFAPETTRSTPSVTVMFEMTWPVS